MWHSWKISSQNAKLYLIGKWYYLVRLVVNILPSYFFYSYVHWLLIYMLLFVMASKFLKSSLWPLGASLTKVVERKTDLKSFVSATKVHFQSSKKCIWGLLTPELSCYCNRKAVLFLMTTRVATHFNHAISKFQKTRYCRSVSPLK